MYPYKTRSRRGAPLLIAAGVLVAAPVLPATAQCVPPPPGLVAWWPGSATDEISDQFGDGDLGEWSVFNQIGPAFSCAETGGKVTLTYSGGREANWPSAGLSRAFAPPSDDFLARITVTGHFTGGTGNKRAGLRLTDESGYGCTIQTGKDGGSTFLAQAYGVGSGLVIGGFVDGTPITFVIVRAGNALRAYANGTLVLSETTPFRRPVRAELYVYTNLAEAFSADFDEFAVYGHAEDLIGLNPGFLENGAEIVPGKIGGAFRLDGVDDSLTGRSVTSFPLGNAARTITGWIRSDGAGGADRNIFHYGVNSGGVPPTNFHLFLASNGAAAVGNGWGHGFVQGTRSLDDGLWHFLAGVYEGPGTNVARIYVDGVEQNSAVITMPGTAEGTWRMGLFIGGGTPFKGLIDEVDLYARALNPAEIMAIHSAGSEGKCRFSNADGDGIPDNADNCPAAFNPDQLDTDGDGAGDACDPDDDNDTVSDLDELARGSDPLDKFNCGDLDADGCDDCASGVENAADDGLDSDSDGICDAGDPDDDNDTVPDAIDLDPLNRFVCGDLDGDGCDDCGVLGFPDPLADGTDFDGDGFCDFGDYDDDMDGVPDDQDADPYDPYVCRDADADGCDDCGVMGYDAPFEDGPDNDLDGLCDGGDDDDDNDGLADAGEIAFGTDPFNSDTDGDGLLDGTEVDAAAGSGCPSPVDADSDNDTLSDGDEVAGGTNPCDADTDGDGLADNLDPTPTTPGAPPEYLEAEARDLANVVIPALDLSLFTGPNTNANKGRRNSLANRAADAANAIAVGDYTTAIAELESLLEKIDGVSPPPDWMTDSPERAALASEVELLIDLLAAL